MTDINEWLTVDALDLDAQGVARNAEGKVVFIDGALPGEKVRVQTGRRKNNWEQAALVEIRRESAQRVTPGCPNFGLHAGACGAARCSISTRPRRSPSSSARWRTTSGTSPRCAPSA